MKIKNIIATTLGIAALSQIEVRARADEAKAKDMFAMPAPKPWSVSVDGSFSHFGTTYKAGGGSDAVQVSGGVGLGRFVTDHIELRAHFSAGANGDNTDGPFKWKSGSFDYLFQANYYFKPFSQFTPYVGLQGGAGTQINGDVITTNPEGGGQVGIQYFLSDKHNISVFAEYSFLYVPLSDRDEYHNLFKVGLKFHFGS